MTPQSHIKFLKWLKEEIETAKAELTEEQSGDPNSFGSGYEAGYLAAYQAVWEYFYGESL